MTPAEAALIGPADEDQMPPEAALIPPEGGPGDDDEPQLALRPEADEQPQLALTLNPEADELALALMPLQAQPDDTTHTPDDEQEPATAEPFNGFVVVDF